MKHFECLIAFGLQYTAAAATNYNFNHLIHLILKINSIMPDSVAFFVFRLRMAQFFHHCVETQYGFSTH